MNSRNNLLLGIAAGAGVALGIWLNSKEGKQKRKQWMDTANRWAEDGSTLAKEYYDTASEKANTILDESTSRAEQYINNATDKATEILDKGIQIAEKAKEKTSQEFHLTNRKNGKDVSNA